MSQCLQSNTLSSKQNKYPFLPCMQNSMREPLRGIHVYLCWKYKAGQKLSSNKRDKIVYTILNRKKTTFVTVGPLRNGHFPTSKMGIKAGKPYALMVSTRRRKQSPFPTFVRVLFFINWEGQKSTHKDTAKAKRNGNNAWSLNTTTAPFLHLP